MRTFLSCLFAALALVAAPLSAQSDIVKRPVQFAKGKSGATIKGSVAGDQAVDYTLRAVAGQTMTVKLTGGPTVYHNVLPPGSTGVARAGGGTAAVSITRPDGRKRVIFFKAGKAVGADLSQADGNMSFSATKEADLYMIRAGNQRYEIPEAVIYGG